MSPTLDVSCTHERRPGTAACLYCRREARLATRARHNRFFARTGTIGLGLVVIAMASVSGMKAFTGWRPPAWVRNTASAVMIVQSRNPGTPHLMLVSSDGRTPATHPPVVASVSPSILGPATRAVVPPLQPIVSQGTTMLPDSLVAVRSGDSVTLHFDTPGTRTRRPEKFEQIVRSTLPAIYGPSVGSLLARIPIGRLAQAGDLLTELPTRGVRLSLGAGWILGVWPETRTGHDGPLVVTYRTLVMR
ncbi:MAG: hypothetical protein ACHQTF_05925 [Gemmatimonadales bacterium]|jgi:hypothetical protein